MSGNGRNYQYDREAVVTADLAAVLWEWREQHEANHPSYSIGMGEDAWTAGVKNRQVTAIQHICQECGIDERALHRIFNCETLTTSLWLADMILTKLGLLHRFHELREVSRSLANSYAYKKIRSAKLEGKVVPKTAAVSQEEWLEYLDRIGCRR